MRRTQFCTNLKAVRLSFATNLDFCFALFECRKGFGDQSEGRDVPPMPHRIAQLFSPLAAMTAQDAVAGAMGMSMRILS